MTRRLANRWTRRDSGEAKRRRGRLSLARTTSRLRSSSSRDCLLLVSGGSGILQVSSAPPSHACSGLAGRSIRTGPASTRRCRSRGRTAVGADARVTAQSDKDQARRRRSAFASATVVLGEDCRRDRGLLLGGDARVESARSRLRRLSQGTRSISGTLFVPSSVLRRQRRCAVEA